MNHTGKTKLPSGVVLPERKTWNQVTGREGFIETEAHNDCLDEVARLNQPASAGDDRETIRAVFLRNGFTIKEGQADLKPYVYAAADELMSIARAALSAPSHGEQVRDLRPLRRHADKIFNKVNAAAEQYEKGQSALGLMEDIAESALILRNGLDGMLAAPSAGSQGGDV